MNQQGNIKSQKDKQKKCKRQVGLKVLDHGLQKVNLNNKKKLSKSKFKNLEDIR